MDFFLLFVTMLSPVIFACGSYACYKDGLYYGTLALGILSALAAVAVGYAIFIFKKLRA